MFSKWLPWQRILARRKIPHSSIPLVYLLRNDVSQFHILVNISLSFSHLLVSSFLNLFRASFRETWKSIFIGVKKKLKILFDELFLWKRKNRRIEWKSGKRTKFTIRFSTQIILYNGISSPSKRALFEFYWRWKQKLTYFYCPL